MSARFNRYRRDRAALVANFQRRVIQDALTEASAWYWQRRAEMFDQARSRPGDYRGAWPRGDLDARDERLACVTDACRNRAAFLRGYGCDQELLAADLWTVAVFGVLDVDGEAA